MAWLRGQTGAGLPGDGLAGTMDMGSLPGEELLTFNILSCPILGIVLHLQGEGRAVDCQCHPADLYPGYEGPPQSVMMSQQAAHIKPIISETPGH